jgi:hypothetical protein
LLELCMPSSTAAKLKNKYLLSLFPPSPPSPKSQALTCIELNFKIFCGSTHWEESIFI